MEDLVLGLKSGRVDSSQGEMACTVFDDKVKSDGSGCQGVLVPRLRDMSAGSSG
jgi:hypothetical protein